MPPPVVRIIPEAAAFGKAPARRLCEKTGGIERAGQAPRGLAKIFRVPFGRMPPKGFKRI
jgi:hypothetical protein